MLLCINIDHIATLREARGGLEPDPLTAAHLCELAGADGIVCHLREDRRHINDRDLRLLRETVKTKLDMEMAVTEEMMKICVETIPDLATFVPEKREELTTEGGLDVAANVDKYAKAIHELHRHDIEVSVFVDPVDRQIDAAADAGADIVELHTGDFSRAALRSAEELAEQTSKLRDIAAYAKSLELGVNAGHGINYANIQVLRTITDIDEVSIGHSIIARAVFVGLPKAVEEMLRLAKG